MNTNDLMAGLPGEALIREGLADFQSGRHTIPACLIGIARQRLSSAGLLDHASVADSTSADVELQLYELLRREGGDAYSRYNALLRELTSFASAYERRRAALIRNNAVTTTDGHG